MEKDDLYRLQQAIEDGEEPCPQWILPNVVVDRSSVLLDGRVLAARSSLPAGTVKRIDPLFIELKLSRELWKQTHPSRPFEPLVKMTIAPDLDGLCAISVLLSAAYAGFPHLEVESGGVRFSAYWAVPEPPRPYGEDPNVTLRIAPADGRSFAWRLEGGSAKQAPEDGIARDIPSLLQTLSETCQARSERRLPCATVLELQVARGEFIEVAMLVQTLMSSSVFAMRRPTLRLTGPGSP
jgi:hypothetical protein